MDPHSVMDSIFAFLLFFLIKQKHILLLQFIDRRRVQEDTTHKNKKNFNWHKDLSVGISWFSVYSQSALHVWLFYKLQDCAF